MPKKDSDILLTKDIQSLSDENKNKIELKLLYPRLFSQYLGGEIEIHTLENQWNELTLSLLDAKSPRMVVEEECESDVELF